MCVCVGFVLFVVWGVVGCVVGGGSRSSYPNQVFSQSAVSGGGSLLDTNLSSLIRQHTDLSTYQLQLRSQAVNQSVSQPASQLVSMPVRQSTSQSVSQTASPCVGRNLCVALGTSPLRCVWGRVSWVKTALTLVLRDSFDWAAAGGRVGRNA